MSNPANPAPEPTPQDPPADPAADPVTDPAPVDPPADPADETDPRVKRANAEAAKYRTQLRDTKAELEGKLAEQAAVLAKLAAVFNPEADPAEDPAQQAAEATAKAEQLTTRVGQLEAELLVHTIAGENGGNPVALLDSRNFTTALHGLDPAADDYTEQVAKAISDAVSKNASLSAAGQGPSRGGAPGAGQGPAAPGAVTQEQFDAMGPRERNDLYRNNPDLYRRLASNIR